MTIVMREMLRCLDIRIEVWCFGKTHRPEEQAKLAAANDRLAELKRDYPASWYALGRVLGHVSGTSRHEACEIEAQVYDLDFRLTPILVKMQQRGLALDLDAIDRAEAATRDVP